MLDAQPGSNDVLVRVQSEDKDNRLYLQFRAKGEAAATLPDKLDGAMLAQRLREAAAAGKSASVPPEFLKVDWLKPSGGNAARGRKLFGSLGCAKCHAITADQKGGGAPSLSQAGKRFTAPYVVESILLPSKQVADAFRSSTITLTDGRVLTGLVMNETADGLELLQPDATRKAVLKKDIEARKCVVSVAHAGGFGENAARAERPLGVFAQRQPGAAVIIAPNGRRRLPQSETGGSSCYLAVA